MKRQHERPDEKVQPEKMARTEQENNGPEFTSAAVADAGREATGCQNGDDVHDEAEERLVQRLERAIEARLEAKMAARMEQAVARVEDMVNERVERVVRDRVAEALAWPSSDAREQSR